MFIIVAMESLIKEQGIYMVCAIFVKLCNSLVILYLVIFFLVSYSQIYNSINAYTFDWNSAFE